MKSKKNNDLSKIKKPVSLLLMLDMDIKILKSYSNENISDIDQSIHEIRKSLKSISAILLLFKVQFEKSQYLNWQSYIKDLSKQYATLRDPYIYLKTFKKFEDEFKEIPNNEFIEIKNHFELGYKLIDQRKDKIKAIIQEGNASIILIIETFNKSNIQSEFKLLKKKLSNTFQKSQKIFKKLSLTSSSEKFHEFRKCCKSLYLQETVINRIGFEKPNKQFKKLYKLTEYLGNEHDIQLLNKNLKIHFPEFTKKINKFLILEILKLRKKVFKLYSDLQY
jgi:CHAD domain-containing protein